ncbi:portal protein [Rhodobacter phage RcMotherGoose]|nr:portal protein [Rhodobacter phage RcMotherGoose]
MAPNLSTQAANVAFINPALSHVMPQYYLIRDAIAGEVAVKAAKTTYLPQPDKLDKSPENKARYDDYLLRAVFYNVTRRTLNGLVGQVFSKDPIFKLPAQLAVLEKNVSGSGITLTQQAKKTLNFTVAFSRCGLHVDYPTTAAADGEEGVVTVADIQANRIRPTINLYSPLEIVNWRMTEDGAEERLSLVVLLESYIANDDGFEIKNAAQFRVLRLTNGVYTQEVWREPQPTAFDGSKVPKGKNFKQHETLTPRGPDGKPLDYIPFMFVGSDNNDPTPDNPNFYDLASLNMAHYRNSADYEDSCFIVGQPTPVVTGLTEDWLKDVMGGVVKFGSRGGIPLPAGASAELLQASENTMIKEAMETKERQMVALGAKLVEQKAVQQTATEAKQNKASEVSTLASATLNVQAAYNWAIGVAAFFAGATAAEDAVTLNTDFDIMNMSPEERRQTIEEWQKGAITFEEMRTVLRKSGTATEDDAKAKEKIANDAADALALAAEAMGDGLDADGNPLPKKDPAANNDGGAK